MMTLMRRAALGALIVCAFYAAWQLKSINQSLASANYQNRQVELYARVAELAATIASPRDETERATALAEFERMNSGTLVLFSDETVGWAASLMISCMENPEDERCRDRELDQLASGLAKAMRRSLLNGAGRSDDAG